MAIEAKDILDYLGVKAETIDELKEKFDSEFAKKSALKDHNSDVHKEFFPIAIGRLAGSVTKDLVKALKDSGIEVSQDEIKDKRLEDVVSLAFGKTKDFYSGKLTELEGSVGKNKDEAVKELEDKYGKLNKKYGDLDGLHKTLQSTYETEKSGFASQIKSIRLENIIGKKHEAIKWASTAKPLEKEGFFSHLKNNYKLELDDSGNLELFDKTGSRIPNPTKAGTFKTYDDILPEDGVKFGVWEQAPNPQSPRRVNTVNAGTYSPQQLANGAEVIRPGQVRKMSNSVK